MRVFLKLTLTIVIATLAFSNTLAQTYYYEQVAAVNNGVKTDKSGDGFFLTFSGDQVYESNSSGRSLGYGSLKFVRSEGGRSLYVGSTYLFLGAELQYVFNSDRSRINVHLDNSRILVYERKNTVSNPRQYESIHIDPVIDSSGSSSGSRGQNGNSNGSRSRTKCSHCNGSGDDAYSTGMSGYGAQTKWCSKCNKNVSMDHAHRTCPYCNGTGYK